ncbi:MAG: methyltransferase [Planctomycetota bacterium]
MSCCPRLSPWWYTKVTIALALMAHGVVHATTGWSAMDRWVIPTWVAQLTIASGALIVATHYGVLKRSTKDIARPERLVTGRALYPWVRHPMYLGDFIVIVGLALLCPTPIALTVAASSVIALWGLCRHEDRVLARSFPEEFPPYQARTRQFLPFVL